MCENGVNTDQMGLMIGQVSGSLSISQQSLEQIHHLADHADLHGPGAAIAQANVLLGEAEIPYEKLKAMDEVKDKLAEMEL